MKRLLLSIVLVLTMAMAVQAQHVKFGFKGGLDIVDMKFSEEVFNTSNKVGWFVGPTLQASIIAGLGADISAFYDLKQYELTTGQSTSGTTSKTENIKQRSVLVPINVRYKIGLGETAGVYLAAGPQFAFNIGDDYKDIFKDDALQSTFQLKKSNLSINLGAGVYLSEHFEVGFAYNIALGSTADANWKNSTKDIDSKPKSWQISAAYLF